MGDDREPSRPSDGSERSGADPLAIDVLVVEDEALIRDIAQTALENGGYSVRVAHGGRAALAMLQAEGGEPRVLVIDVALGLGPSGWEVARRAREIAPRLPIVYTTGGDGHEYAAHGVPNSVLLSKPFIAEEILSAVSGQIGAGARVR